MKKKKFAIHWQILLALFLAIIYGIMFPNKHIVTSKSYNNIDGLSLEYNISHDMLSVLENMIGNNPETEIDFIKLIESNPKIKLTDDQKRVVLNETKYNPPVSYISWMGIIFLKSLKMVIIPLILMSIIKIQIY